MKYLLIMFIVVTCMSCKQDYNKDIWIKNQNQSSDNPRFEMTKDLRENYLLKGMSIDTVFSLLDEPKYIDTIESRIQWTYPIGSNPGFHIDPYYLVIDFDSTGHLIETDMHVH
ncbi:hypothetical protein [Bernardetia sp.]|uniref:hypothetical protein n=1 Tax=Bernardetia sp. TaxID=1937974 RepID=UPI0025BE7877|nr:hypothetical protein [Bernardetia sp.]